MSDWVLLLAERQYELGVHTIKHLVLTGVAVFFAVIIGLPLGLWVTRNAKVRGPVLGLVGIIQTIPSLALLGLMLPLLGIGEVPAITALALYALLPIVRNTYAGLDGVPDELVEAARGLGFTDRQRLWRVEIPLAMPVIVAGLRTATVISVGVATLAAFIGAGGLGEFMFRGLQSNNTNLILLGAIPAALLALLLDFAIGRVEGSLRRDPVSGRRPSTARALAWAIIPALLVIVVAYGATWRQRSELASAGGVITIGGKAFSEQRIIGEMMVCLIETKTDLRVTRQFDLGGTKIVHGALVGGQIDLYPEYTGTALMEILGHDVMTDRDAVYELVQREYRERFDCEWLAPFGFNNAYCITVRQDQAARQGWRRISDLEPAAPDLVAGFTGEFIERPDGYAAFPRVYGFRFGNVRMMEAGLMYQAAAEDKVDVISGYATDGRIPAFDLLVLDDDKHLFPPYYAAPVIRSDTLARYPKLREALAPLGGLIDDETMQRLNFEVDENHRSAMEVAREFLDSVGLLPAEGGTREG